MGIHELILATKTFKAEKRNKIAVFDFDSDINNCKSYLYFFRELGISEKSIQSIFSSKAVYFAVMFDKNNNDCWCQRFDDKEEMRPMFKTNMHLLILNVERF